MGKKIKPPLTNMHIQGWFASSITEIIHNEPNLTIARPLNSFTINFELPK